MKSIRITVAQKKVLVFMARGWELVGYADTRALKMGWYLRSEHSPYRDVPSKVVENLLTKKLVMAKLPYSSNLLELTTLGREIANREW